MSDLRIPSPHPGGLSEDVLVGDGGKSWFHSQQQRQLKQKQIHRPHQQEFIIPPNDRSKLSIKQQRNRLKRQKKKHRKQNAKQTNNKLTEAHKRQPPNANNTANRSNFLYGTHPATNTQKPIHHHTHAAAPQLQNSPYAAQTTAPNPHSSYNTTHNPPSRHHQQKFKTYISASNQEELNKISAQMFKAQLASDDTLYNTLKLQCDSLRASSVIIEQRYISSNPPNPSNTSNPSIAPTQTPTNAALELITDAKLTKQLHNIDNAANASDNIQSLVSKERSHSAIDQNLCVFNAKHLNKLSALRHTDDQFDTMQEEHKDNPSRKRKLTQTQLHHKEERQQASKRARLVSQHKANSQWLQSCRFCVDNEALHNAQMAYAVVFRGRYMYIALSKHESLVDYECVIVPNVHIKSFREGILHNEHIGASKEEQQDFDQELRLMQKMLCKVFRGLDCGVVFIETVRNLKRNYHTVICCYPVQFEEFDLCPVYFEKAIVESDVEWSTNKKLVRVSKEKKLRQAIPHFMAYFYVQFGLQDGFVHVIEDETKVKQDFGAQIIAGIVGKVLFKIKNEPVNKHVERIAAFKKVFEPCRQELNAKLKLTSVTQVQHVL